MSVYGGEDYNLNLNEGDPTMGGAGDEKERSLTSKERYGYSGQPVNAMCGYMGAKITRQGGSTALHIGISSPQREHFFSTSMLCSSGDELDETQSSRGSTHKRHISPKGKRMTALIMPHGPYFFTTSWSPLAQRANTALKSALERRPCRRATHFAVDIHSRV